MSGDNTTPIRIAAIFTIFVTSVLTGVLPLVIKVLQDPISWPTRIVRSFGAGVILSLALVHIIPEGIERLGVQTSYEPLGGVVVVGGVLLVLLFEHLVHAFMSADETFSCQHGGPAPTSLNCSSDGDTVVSVQDTKSGTTAVTIVHSGSVASEAGGKGAITAKVLPPASSTVACESGSRLRAMACIFEFGCIFHSVIIGINLGVISDDLGTARALFIALVFHQALEAISLGTVIVQGRFFGVRGLLMVLAYSITCPIGIAIGMGIASSYDPDSIRATVSQGVFDSISGGLLLYIALVQLISEDMGRMERGNTAWRTRLITLFCLCVGAALMSVLAIWDYHGHDHGHDHEHVDTPCAGIVESDLPRSTTVTLLDGVLFQFRCPAGYHIHCGLDNCHCHVNGGH